MANDSQKPSSNDPGRAEGLSLDNGLDYRIIFNATSNGMAFTEFGSGMIIDVNAAWIRSTGIVREKAIGRTAFELGLWAKAEREACYAELDKKGRIVDFEARLIMKSAELPHLISGEAIEMSGKRYVLWEFRDITERKQAEKLFRSLAANSPVGVYIVQKGKFVYANSQFQQYSGYREDELLGMEALSLVIPEDRETVRNNAAQMLKGKRVVPYEFRMTNKNGEIKWALESAASIQHQGKQATIGSYQDITERKQAEETLKASEARYRQLIETMNEGLAVTDKDLRLTFMNERFCTMLEYPRKELMGHRIIGFVHEDFREVTENHCTTRKKGESAPYVMAWKKKGGETIYTQVSPRALFDGQGNYLGSIGVLTDITERKRTEEQIKSQLEELQRWQDVMLGREDRVQELKREVNELCRRLGEKIRYSSHEEP